MELNLVPIVVFAIFFLMTPQPSADVQGKTDEPTAHYHNVHDENKSPKMPVSESAKALTSKLKVSWDNMFDESKEKEGILSYITSVFKNISLEDAKEISEGLVEYGKKHDLDPKLAAAVIARESGFKKEAVSRTGAAGLGQIKDFNFKSLSIKDPFNIKQNVSGTTQYLKFMLSKWNGDEKDVDMALASYYKGFTNVKKTGVDEKTKSYVDDILEYYDSLKKYRDELENAH